MLSFYENKDEPDGVTESKNENEVILKYYIYLHCHYMVELKHHNTKMDYNLPNCIRVGSLKVAIKLVVTSCSLSI